MNTSQDNQVFDAIDGRQLEAVAGGRGALLRNVLRGVGVGGLIAAPILVTELPADVKAKVMGTAATLGAGGGWLLYGYKQGYKDAARASAQRLGATLLK